MPADPEKPATFQTIAFLGGVVLCGGGGWAFVYAHYHDPKPDADPEAVHLLSRADYDLLHYGGVALMAVGVLLVLGDVRRRAKRAAGSANSGRATLPSAGSGESALVAPRQPQPPVG